MGGKIVRAVMGWNWKLIIFTLLILPPLGLLYFHINAAGIRDFSDITATRLYRLPIPLFARLKDYEGLHPPCAGPLHENSRGVLTLVSAEITVTSEFQYPFA